MTIRSIAISILISSPVLFASTVYVSQSGGSVSCGVDGTQSTTAVASISWGTSNTYKLCGTITVAANATALTVGAGGTSGNPLIIYFESGASLQSPYFSGSGAIYINGYSYVTVNGGTNGIIENTANGTLKTYQVGSTEGVLVSNAPHATIENLHIENLYVNNGSGSGATDANGLSSTGVYVEGSSTGEVVTSNTISMVSVGINSGNTASGTNATISNNTITDAHWHIAIGGTGTALVYNNTLSNWTDWWYPDSTYHTDGIIVFGDSTIITPQIYNNSISGDLGLGSPTGFIFCTYGTSGNGSGSACTIFNNLLVGTGSMATGNDALIYFHGSATGNALGPHQIYNNTFVNGGYGIDMDGDTTTHYSLVNNIFVGAPGGITWAFHQESVSPPFSIIVDFSNNDYYGLRTYGPWNWDGNVYSSLSAWQAACSCDSDSITTNPNLNGSYVPNSGSPVIGTGANLTSLGITALDSDITGATRPSTGAWTEGAYNYGTSPPPSSTTGVLSILLM